MLSAYLCLVNNLLKTIAWRLHSPKTPRHLIPVYPTIPAEALNKLEDEPNAPNLCSLHGPSIYNSILDQKDYTDNTDDNIPENNTIHLDHSANLDRD